MVIGSTQSLTSSSPIPAGRPLSVGSENGATSAVATESTTDNESAEDSRLGAATIVELTHLSTPGVSPHSEARIPQNEEIGRSMETIKRELTKIDALISKRRPELAGSWDFQLVDGKFKVSGLNAEDAKWLERKLNSNVALKGAAESLVSTAVINLEASSTNPPRKEFSYATGNIENYTFYDVRSQLSDKLSFRSMLQQSDQIFDSNKIDLDANARGVSGLAVVARMLVPSNQPIGGHAGGIYSSKYDPL